MGEGGERNRAVMGGTTRSCRCSWGSALGGATLRGGEKGREKNRGKGKERRKRGEKGKE